MNPVYEELRRQQALAEQALPREWITGGIGIGVDGEPFLTVRVRPGLRDAALARLHGAGVSGPLEVIEMRVPTARGRAANPAMREPVHPYRYPVDPAIPEQQLVAELGELLQRGGLVGDGGPMAQVWLWDPLDVEHARNPRRYAQVIPDWRRFEFARATLQLPRCQRLGLLAHEVGHVLAPDGGEDEADQAAADILGVPIAYDERWPGKGLQIALNCQGRP